ncbi:MAG: flagellar hook-basal body complex protein [Terracidiphilus sp.]
MGTLTIVGAGVSVTPASSSLKQDVALTTTNYNFANSNGALATVDPSTNLTIQIGGGAAVAAPAFSAGETVAQYAAALQAAAGPAATSGVTVSGAGGVLSITGPSNMTIAGTVTQDFSAAKLNYAFGSYTDPATGLTTQAPVDPSTSLTITSLTTGGTPATVTVTPTNPAGESVAQYVIDLNNALAASNISGVTATSANGVLSLTGPSAMTVGGYINQDILGTTISSSVTPTSPVTTSATVALPAASLTPASTSTTTLAAAAPVTTGVSGILPADATTTPSASNSTLTASTPVAGTTAYTFAPTGTVAAGTSLTITDGVNTCTVTPSSPNESLAAFASDITTALGNAVPGAITATATGTDGVPGTNTNGTLTIVGAGVSVTPASSSLKQDVAETTTNYDLVSSNGAVAQVGASNGVPPTNLSIKLGNGAAVSAPAFASGMSLAAYATALQNAVGAPAVSGVTIQANAVTGLLSITGPANMAIAGNLAQDFSGKSTSYSFSATGTVDAATNLTITGPTTAGGTATVGPLTVNPNEPVGTYVAALNTALGVAGITGVSVVNNSGQVSIVGPSSMVIGGAMKQDVAMTTTNYNFVTSNGTQATVAPSTTLAISEGGGAPVSVPAFSSSQSVAAYAANLQSALTSAGINDVTVAAANGQLSITGPANMTITGGVKQSFTGAQTSFDFGSYTDPNTGLTAQATVAPTASLTISGPTTAGGSTTITVTPSNPAGESVAQYVADVQNALAAAKITGVTVAATNGTMTITGPDTVTVAGTMNQDMLGTTSNYAFETNATVDPTTNLRITGQTAVGGTATIVAPSVSNGETLAQYATALTSALSTAGITNVSVTAANGQLSITGANISTTGSIKQGLADTTISYDFGSTATVNPATSLTIVGPTVSGTPPTAITVAPAVTAGETVAQYAADLTKALKNAGINTGADGVSVTSNGGQLTIVGPAATLKTAGVASQDLTATTISYNFGLSGGTIATVDPKTSLTITGQTASGATATTVAPTVTLGETLAQYVNALNNALTDAGIAGVTVSSTAGGTLSIAGANLSTAGSVIQDPVGSANANGTLTFDANGNLVNPSADLSNVTFGGLSDNAAPMNLTWNLFGANGSGEISQTAVASGQSAQLANGYAAGTYQDFSIGSDGTITAKYSNGQNQVVGQIGLATVNNLQGLADVGSTEYRTTTASGAATVGVAGTGGLGTLEGSSLEASNVNISQEFSDLIIAQRAFEANSKAVTTFDTVTQETINMIH